MGHDLHLVHCRYCRCYRPDLYQGVLVGHDLVHLRLSSNYRCYRHQTTEEMAVWKVYRQNVGHSGSDHSLPVEGALAEFLHILDDSLKEVYYSFRILSNLIRGSDQVSLLL